MKSLPTLTWKELEELRSKAKALDEAVEWMTGRLDSEQLMTVYYILTKQKCENDRAS